MKPFFLALTALFLMACTSANAATVTYSWEDGQTILGSYKAITATNTDETAYDGNASLKLVDGGDSGTPQAYVGWITGLNDGDTVTAGFWVYDTASGSPSGRIWGHYTDDDTDISSYTKSAGGNSTYSGTSGWSYLEHTWTFDAAKGTGLVIEVRTYSGAGDTIWVDNLTIIAPDSSVIQTPGISSTVPVPGSLILLSFGILALTGKGRKRH